MKMFGIPLRKILTAFKRAELLGAGKSTLIEQFGSGFDIIVNQDQIAKQINPDNFFC